MTELGVQDHGSKASLREMRCADSLGAFDLNLTRRYCPLQWEGRANDHVKPCAKDHGA